MSFTSTITLNDAQATPLARDFVEVSQDSTGSVRIDKNTDLANPILMTIRHSVQKGKDGLIIDRHLVQFSTVKTSTTGQKETAIVNLTLAVPRSGTVSRTNVDHMIAFVKNFLNTTDAVSQLLRGER